MYAMGMKRSFIESSFLFWGIHSIVLSTYLFYKVNDKTLRQDSRMILFLTLAYQVGFMQGPIVNNEFIDIDPEIVIQAVVYTGVTFISFSVVSLLSKRRSMLFVGSIILCLILAKYFYNVFYR